MGITLGAIAAALFVAWFGGRAHLRAGQLKKLDQAAGLPDGALESQVNQAVEKAAATAGPILAKKIDGGKP